MSSTRHNKIFPGFELGIDDFSSNILLLVGPAGVGKSLYCRQFILDGVSRNDNCIYLGPLTEPQFRKFLSSHEPYDPSLTKRVKLLNLSHYFSPHFKIDSDRTTKTIQPALKGGSEANDARKLDKILMEIESIILNFKIKKSNIENNDVGRKILRFVFDSLDTFLVFFEESIAVRFIARLAYILKENEAFGIFIMSASSSDYSYSKKYLHTLCSLLDGVIEMKFSDFEYNNMCMRISSIKGEYYKSYYKIHRWINYNISSKGVVKFSSDPIENYVPNKYDTLASPATVEGITEKAKPVCALCSKPILGDPFIESDFYFDTKKCLETYRKLSLAYGSNTSAMGLPGQVIDAHFFFIDIVSLSNPLLSLRGQIQKIQVLNNLISSCSVFKKVKENKIILPTGDGMVIGFLLNPELPLQLAIELHKKLALYESKTKSNDNNLEVRIGLSSGPVFIVSDISDNPNIWGPGIVLARRVMDIGDGGHILLAGNLAEKLISLNEEYRSIIRPIGSYLVKHTQTIRVYSAYSQEFGNPEIPKRLSQ